MMIESRWACEYTHIEIVRCRYRVSYGMHASCSNGGGGPHVLMEFYHRHGSIIRRYVHDRETT